MVWCAFPQVLTGLVTNMRRLGLDPRDIEITVLSHGHSDHTTGLDGFIRAVGRCSLPVLIHPDFWNRRRLMIPGRDPVELPGRRPASGAYATPPLAGVTAAQFRPWRRPHPGRHRPELSGTLRLYRGSAWPRWTGDNRQVAMVAVGVRPGWVPAPVRRADDFAVGQSSLPTT